MRIIILLSAMILLSGCGADVGFPEDQRMDGPYEITPVWKVIEFDVPLAINREGAQGFHFVVDESHYHPRRGRDVDNPFDVASLQRSDGVVVRPEVILIGDNGKRVELHAVSHVRQYAGGLTLGFRTFKDRYSLSPPFPEEITSFSAVEVRSNEPFVAEYLRWRMDSHPDHHRCGGRRCTWLEKVFQ